MQSPYPMKKLVIPKRSRARRPLGEKIGPVRIKELSTRSAEGFFALDNGADDYYVAGFYGLDNAIGYCHQNLIQIESIERLKENTV
jgi:hypothetical protein